jgi:hypothetical protein
MRAAEGELWQGAGQGAGLPASGAEGAQGGGRDSLQLLHHQQDLYGVAPPAGTAGTAGTAAGGAAAAAAAGVSRSDSEQEFKSASASRSDSERDARSRAHSFGHAGAQPRLGLPGAAGGGSGGPPGLEGGVPSYETLYPWDRATEAESDAGLPSARPQQQHQHAQQQQQGPPPPVLTEEPAAEAEAERGAADASAPSYRAQRLQQGRTPSKLNMKQWEDRKAEVEAEAGAQRQGGRKPSRDRRLSLSNLRVLGAGTGGLAELHDNLDPRAVRFALIRLEFGHGTFAATKVIFVHSVGELTPPLQRARATAHKFAVQSSLGQSHAAVGIEQVADCTPDVLLPRVAHLFVQEGQELKSAVGDLKAAYVQMLERALAKPRAVRVRGTARELGLIREGGGKAG